MSHPSIPSTHSSSSSSGCIVRQVYSLDGEGREVNTSDEVERHPAWSELVLDLVIVANFYQLGKCFTDNCEHYGVLAVLLYYAQFAPQFDRWVDATILLNKFDTGNTYSMWSLLVFTLINRSIPQLNEGNMKPFAFCMMLSIAGAMVFNFYVAWSVPCTRVSTITGNVVQAANMALWLVIWLSPSFYVACATWVVVLVFPSTSLYSRCRPIVEKYIGDPGATNVRIPIDVELMTERLGLLIVLAIGEVLMTTVKAAVPPSDQGFDLSSTSWLPVELSSLRPFVSISLAIGLAGHTKLAYFDTYGCPGEEASGVKKHAFKNSVRSSLNFMRFHMLAVMSIVLSAGMMEISDEEFARGDQALSFDNRIISGIAFAGINASFGILREQHIYEDNVLENELVSRRARVWVLIGVCSAQVLGAVLVPASVDPLWLQLLGQVLFAANIFFEECCRNRWVKNPRDHQSHAVFTDHSAQESHCTTSVGGLTHITNYSSTTSPTISNDHVKHSLSENTPLLTATL